MTDGTFHTGTTLALRREAGGIRVLEVTLDRPRAALPLQSARVSRDGFRVGVSVLSAAGGDRLELGLFPGAPSPLDSIPSTGATIEIEPAAGRGIDVARLAQKDLLLVGAAEGIAVLRSLLLTSVRGAEHPRSLTALFGARRPEDLPFASEFRELAAAGSLDLRLAVEEAPPGWPGALGLVPILFRRYKLDPPATIAVIAGPGSLHKFAVLELLMRGVPETAIHVVPERGFGCELDPCSSCARGGRYVCERGPVFSWNEVKTSPAPYF